MSQENDGFEVVVTKSTTWEPKQTGSKKEGNLVKLEANDKSYVVGYYIGTEEIKMKDNKTSTVHKLQILRGKDGKCMVGSSKHLSGDPKETNDVVTIWGTGVLDGKIAENVQLGAAVKIIWKGATVGKSGNSYHTWDIALNSSIEPLDLNAKYADADTSEFDDDKESPVAAKTEKVSAAIDDDFEDDDIPF